MRGSPSGRSICTALPAIRRFWPARRPWPPTIRRAAADAPRPEESAMRRLPAQFLPVLTALAAAGLCGAAAAATRPALTWGKPGVSFEDYRADATACLRAAVATDLTGTEPAEALALASRRIETAMNTDPWSVAEVTDMARPDLRIREARDIIQARLNECLVAHGYHRFRLTDAQRRQLNHFGMAQPERQVYLHSLASDPQILANQSVDETAAR